MIQNEVASSNHWGHGAEVLHASLWLYVSPAPRSPLALGHRPPVRLAATRAKDRLRSIPASQPQGNVRAHSCKHSQKHPFHIRGPANGVQIKFGVY